MLQKRLEEFPINLVNEDNKSKGRKQAEIFKCHFFK